MKNLFANILIFFVVFSFIGCRSRNNSTHDKKLCDSIVTNQYAEYFKIEYFEHYKKITVLNPWKENAVFDCYYLSKDSLPFSDGTFIQTPIKNVIATSCSLFEFFHLINETNKISGVCDIKRIYNKEIQEKYQNKELDDVGSAFAINMEKVLRINPSAVFINGFNEDDQNGNRIKSMNIPTIYTIEWVEKNALARAEWIKFVAAFFDKEQYADSIFKEIEHNYNSSKALVSQIKQKPTILSGNSFNGVWYLPGGKSFLAQLYNDAGGNFNYKNDDSMGSLTLDFETILEYYHDADIWLNAVVNNRNELLNQEARLTYFKPIKENRVYNFNKRCTSTGGNDYWETAIARPDILLKDIISVIHPEILDHYEPFFINAVE